MKAFIIYLSSIASSVHFAKLLKQGLVVSGVQAELFEGTTGIDAIEIFKKENRNDLKLEYNGKIINGTERPGVKGCFYSHYRLWEKCVNLDEPILIFEDDVILSRGFNPIEWNDILIVSMTAEWKTSKKFFKYLENPISSSLPIDWPNYCLPGTSGYGITPSGALKLINFYKNSYSAVDHAINKDIVDIKIHPSLMGRALMPDEQGKESTTRMDWLNKTL
jgi:glycosyl transferase, family 25